MNAFTYLSVITNEKSGLLFKKKEKPLVTESKKSCGNKINARPVL